MNLLKKLFAKKQPEIQKEDGTFKTTGEIITEVTDGNNLVNGKPTYEYVESEKNNLEIMKKCCEAEIKTLEIAGIVPAPYYFERVAIILRKEKNYKQEIEYCSSYISIINKYYSNIHNSNIADVRKGPRYQSIVKRLKKAKTLEAKV
ncbi:MAG: hypothetical protein COA30_05110 [Sulfurimonas sp.]|nr:MAG: hypothetical protein COA30_05110 [Sulfurimonas sp.]